MGSFKLDSSQHPVLSPLHRIFVCLLKFVWAADKHMNARVFTLRIYLACTLFSLSLFSSMASAQIPGTDLFCNAGLRPNGYVDFSSLPVAPNFPSLGEGGPSNSVPLTVTLPVKGLSGLTVLITIPALQASTPGAVYSVVNGALVLNGLPAATGELLSLQFNKPIAGLGLVANSVGRQSDFTLQTDPPGTEPPNFENAADTLTIAPKFYSIPLQQMDLQGGFDTAFVLYGGGIDFGVPSLSNVRVQSVTASYTHMVPRQGLQQWLMSNSVQNPFEGDAASWPDQSGRNHNATQNVSVHQPAQVQGDGNACQPAFSFSGNQYFNFNLPIDSWQQMTIFLVSKSFADPPRGSVASESAAIFWIENAQLGGTFVSPYQTTEAFRFGTTQRGNQPLYTRPVTVGEDFTVTRAVHDEGIDELYIDGVLALRQGNKLSALGGTTGAAYIGRGYQNTYFHGEISEVLVYDRALTSDEAASVEAYLRNKFGTR